ncbi:MAG: RodZ domain-containing protein [Pseudomonadota bacterium]|uniref:DUF4115 domain-containing protein n=1 Tax=Candidatus Desulfatibia profunda TaxID=2841695 RepID=A0A8J6NUD8_9BACT|nr:DUF4115 domain-containing protein [Candidatus Desulfatibia profunda]MBL7178810.1 DUF4115 domain-containing protein [Desulfobacterales bacterium]
MFANKNYLSFGRYLKAIRLEKGIDLIEVSKETKIGMDYLVMIEKEDHDRLPAEVFVKGFLRAYAQVVDANGDEAVKRYLSSRRVFQEAIGFDADLKRSGQAFWPRLLLSLGALLGIIVLSVLLISVSRHRPFSDNSEMELPNSTHRDISTKDALKKATASEHPKNDFEKLLLKVVVVEDTWMRIIIDGQSTKEYSLKPGDLLELEASSGYNLLIGNAAGVQLTLNGKPVEKFLEKSGQVVTIQIP